MFGCGAAQWEPAKVPFEITHETESGDSGVLQMFWSPSNTKPWFRKTSRPGADEGKVWDKHKIVFNALKIPTLAGNLSLLLVWRT